MKSIITETDWVACDDPRSMIRYLLQKANVSDRKWRLSGVACCRRIWHLLPDERCKQAVEVAELLADGQVSQEVARRAQADSWSVYEQLDADYKAHVYQINKEIAQPPAREIEESHVRANAALATAEVIMSRSGPVFNVKGFPAQSAAAYALADSKVDWTRFDSQQATTEQDDRRRLVNAEKNWQASILRDIFRNPFRPVALIPSCLTVTVISLALAIYTDRTFDRLPILADALEDAGCTNADVLGHCRGPGPHVLGCWVVDLLLGKE